MREIDPIRSPSEALLSGALRRLATGSPQKAPAEVGDALAAAFRHHHRHRRMIRATAILAVAACIVLAVALLLFHRRGVPTEARKMVPAAQPENSPARPGSVATPKESATAKRPLRSQSMSQAQSDDSFLTLPGYDPAVPVEELTMVRVELPGAALRMIGAPVSEELTDRRMLADFVIDQDGTPYAVRLVQ